MNEYSMDAFEALSRALVILRKHNLNVASKEIQEALEKLVTGTGIDFGRRLKLL